MKQLTKSQEDAYAAVVAQRGAVLDGHHSRLTHIAVGLGVLTIESSTGTKTHVVGFGTKGLTTLNPLFWSNQNNNVVLSPISVGPNLDLQQGIKEGVVAFNNANKMNEFTGRKYVLTDVLVF